MSASGDAFKPELTNLVDLLTKSIDRYEERPLFGVPRNGQWAWTTYREFGKLVDCFRAGLASLGVGRGDKVAVIANNRLEWAVAAHATFGIGASYVPMYEAQLDKEWQFILEDCGAKVCLVANAAIERRVRAFEGFLPDLEQIVNFEGDTSDPTSYASLLAHGAHHPVPTVLPAADDVACFIYTSGTTGNPKGVKLTHFNLASNVSAILTNIDLTNRDRGIAFLPWAHVFGGCVELNMTIATGSSTAICSDPTKLVEYMPQVHPTILLAVPRVWNRVYDGVQKQMAAQPPAIRWIFETMLAARRKQKAGKALSLKEKAGLALGEKLVLPKILSAFGGQLRFACSGAAALSRDVAEFMEGLGLEVYEGYGMTETSGCTTAQPLGKVKLGSVGKPIPGVRIEIDKTAPGSTAEDGEIIVYGMGVMQGYHNLDETTRSTMTEDGGLRTGDLGRLDEEGYLFITGRVKELYKLENGKYVAPVPLEEKLQLSPYIAQCVIFGADKPHNVALIIPDAAAIGAWAKTEGIATNRDLMSEPKVRHLLEQEVDKHSKDFKGFERIKDFVIDTEELTTSNGMLTPTLKLKRRNVMTKYGSIFESLYPSAPSNRPEPRASYIRELRPQISSRAQASNA